MAQAFEWQLYVYSLKTFYICIDGSREVVDPGHVQSIYLERDYDNDYLPVFMIQILLGTEMYHRINGASSVKFGVQLVGHIKEDERGNTSGTHDFINGEFTVLTIDSTPFIDQDAFDNMSSSSTYGEGATVPSDLQDSYTFILAKSSDLITTKKVCNTVLTQTDMTSAITYLLSQCSCTNVLMSIPDNPTTYNELILLPIPLINQLRYLNSYYGLYRQGAQIFFDLDRSYILRNNATCSAYNSTENKTTVICVHEGGSGNKYGKGSYTDGTNRLGYINVGIEQFSMQNLATTSSHYSGNNSLIINNSGTVNKTSSGGDDTFNIITTSTHNQYVTTETELRLSELKSVIGIVTTNCDLRLLKPNKYFQVISTSSSVSSAVNKPYRLVSSKVVFVKDGDFFVNTTEATFKVSDAT